MSEERQAAGCPEEAELTALAAGELDEALRERITAHLDECSTCLARFDSLIQAQPMARLLRRYYSCPDTEALAAYAEWLAHGDRGVPIGARIDAMRRHVERCETCSAHVNRLTTALQVESEEPASTNAIPPWMARRLQAQRDRRAPRSLQPLFHATGGPPGEGYPRPPIRIWWIIIPIILMLIIAIIVALAMSMGRARPPRSSSANSLPSQPYPRMTCLCTHTIASIPQEVSIVGRQSAWRARLIHRRSTNRCKNQVRSQVC